MKYIFTPEPKPQLVGPAGALAVREDDEITRKLCMLYEGQCLGLGATAAAQKFDFSRPRYYQLLARYEEQGAAGLASEHRGPKTRSRRTPEVTRQVIRHRFLDAEASPEVIAQKLRQTEHPVSIRSVERVIEEYGLQKKLYEARPSDQPLWVPTQRTRAKTRPEPADPASVERAVRQLLADKISGNQVGIWLLIPEYLRLGVWDLLCGWTGQATPTVYPRLALQLVNEAALCVNGVRAQRTLSQKGFEVANGLPFVASDLAIHDLLAAHTVEQAQALQIALGKIRRASHHFQGQVLAIDPHRLKSTSQRQMRRHKLQAHTKAGKVSNTFFCVDVDAEEPICFTIGTSARTVAQATPELAQMAQSILQCASDQTLILADCEHFSAELIAQVVRDTPFALLVPMPQSKTLQRQLAQIPAAEFTRRWAGLATAKRPFHFRHAATETPTDYYQLIQRSGERAEEYTFNAFLASADRGETEDLSLNYPKRWHAEEFFNAHQALGWQRAGTLNLNIRYGRMSLALVAQAALSQLRRRWGAPFQGWEAKHLAKDVLGGLEGDVRVESDTIVVTYYNAPNGDKLRPHYAGLPAKLRAEGIDPRIPWLYNFMLDFRFL